MATANAFVRKTKVKDVERMQQALDALGDANIVHAWANGATKAVPSLFNETKLAGNVLTVWPEYNRRARTGFLLGMPAPILISRVYRDSNAAAIIVSTDDRSGGCTYEDVQDFWREQACAKNDFPPPRPVLMNDLVVDKFQISLAAAAGASGLLFPASFAGKQLTEFVEYSKASNIEPVVAISDREDAEAALSAGARMLCFTGMSTDEASALRAQLPTSDKIAHIVKFRRDELFALPSEIEAAWAVRDEGFNCVWPTDAMYTNGWEDVPMALFAMGSKASRQYCSPRSFDVKGEGATEYLGELAM